MSHTLLKAATALLAFVAVHTAHAQQGIDPAGPFCSDLPVQQLTAQPSGGVWGGAADALGMFDPALGAQNSPYLVTYAWTDSLGNPQVDSLLVVVNAAPVVVIDPAGPFCANAGVQQLVATPANGIWDADFGTVEQDGTFNPIFGPDFSPYAVWYTVTEPNGCIGADTILVEVVGIPEVIVSEPLTLCLYDDPISVAASPAGGVWTGDVDSTGSFDPAIGPGQYQAIYTYTDSSGCSNARPAAITVWDAQEAVLQDPGPLCSNSTPVAIPASPQGGTYGGVADSLGLVDPTQLNVGVHMVTYTYQCMDCCPTTDTLFIGVVLAPEPEILDTLFCLSVMSVQLEAVPAGGAWSGAADSLGVFMPAMLGSGAHAVTYAITDGFGCWGTTTDSLRVLPEATVVLSGNGPYCSSPIADTLLADVPGGVWSGDVTPDGAFLPSFPGDFLAIHTYSDSVSCVTIDTLFLHVDATPVVAIDAAGPFCNNAAPFAMNAVPPGGTWSGQVDPDGTFDPSTAPLGASTVLYAFSDTTGCASSDSVVVFVVDIPAITFGMNGPLCADDGLVQLEAFPSNGAWSGAVGTDGLFDTAVPPGSYVVSYTYDNGICASSGTDTISVQDCTFIREHVLDVSAVYPNPADVELFIDLAGRPAVTGLRLLDMSGRTLRTPSWSRNGNLLRIVAAELEAGGYVVELLGDGPTLRARITVRH